MKIGLTGGIASGKNYIAKLFAEKGAYVLDADEVARIVIQPGGLAYQAVIDAFGESILDSEGKIDRVQLRNIVVHDQAKLKLLEGITHPAIGKYTKKWTGQVAGKDDKAIIIYHAPLLLEADGKDYYDAIILIYASEETQLRRLKERGYPPYEDALRLMKSQMPYEEKLKLADFVIDNDSTPENAQAEVDRVWNLLKIFLYTKRNFLPRGLRAP